MTKLNFEPDDRVMLKLSSRPEMLILSVLGSDDHGLWLDSYGAKKWIEEAPVLEFNESFEHDWSGSRPALYIPFAQIEYLLKVLRS